MFVLLFLLPSSLLAAKAQSFFQALLLLLSCVDDGFISCCPRFTYSGEKERQKKSENKKKSEGEKGKVIKFLFLHFVSLALQGGMRGGASRVKPPSVLFSRKRVSFFNYSKRGKNFFFVVVLTFTGFGDTEGKEKSPPGIGSPAK